MTFELGFVQPRPFGSASSSQGSASSSPLRPWEERTEHTVCVTHVEKHVPRNIVKHLQLLVSACLLGVFSS